MPNMGSFRATAEVGVLGVGTMGAATCLALARRGISVLGLEAHTIPNDRSSHHGKTRMMRLAYHEHPDYVVLLKEAWRMWRALEEETGTLLLQQTGALYLGSPDGELLQGARSAARQNDLPHRTLDADALRKDFTPFQVPDGCCGLFEDQAGFLYAEDAVRVMARRAVQLGAQMVEGCHISSVDFEEDGVVLHAADGNDYHVRRLVVTAGPGTAVPELHLAPVPLTVTRQELGWFDVARGQELPSQEIPCWAMEAAALDASLDGLFYGFPSLSGEAQLKAALHSPGAAVDPHDFLESDPGELEVVREAMQQLLPNLAGQLSRSAVCRYTHSADGHFLIDRHPTAPHTTIACGFSGHGFKFAPVIGEVLAELCLDYESSRKIDFLSQSRFK